MKWAKLKKDKPPSDEQLASYEYYTDQNKLDNQFSIQRPASGRVPFPPDRTQKNLWVCYELGKGFKPKDEVEYQKFQRDYEMYCGGFLQYYDREVRNKATNHQLYFEWAPFKRDAMLYVALYLFPRPLKVKDRIGIWEPLRANPAAKCGESQRAGETLVERAVATSEEDTNESIDPPHPPPPPPPPRD